MTFRVPPRGCWKKCEEMGGVTAADGVSGGLTLSSWAFLTVFIGWEEGIRMVGKVGGHTTGKYAHELIFTSHALVESLLL